MYRQPDLFLRLHQNNRCFEMIAQLDASYIKTRPYKVWSRIISHLFFQGRFLGTKYRWLNKIILANLHLWQRFPLGQTVEKPIFIVGMGRSGSTILGKILSLHPDIGFLNESKAVWYTVDPQCDIVGHFQTGAAKYHLTAEDAGLMQQQTARKLFYFYAGLTRSRRILDKNPEIVYRLSFVKTIFPDAKFILLVRNGWDTVYSVAHWWQQVNNMTNPQNEAWWGVKRRKWQLMLEQLVPIEPLLASRMTALCTVFREEDMAAVEWILTMQEGLRVLHQFRDSVYKLEYEALVTCPKQTLIELGQFIELARDEKMYSYAQQILITKPVAKRVRLLPEIEGAFHQTLVMLGYDVV